MSDAGGALLLLIEDDLPTRRALVANLAGHGHQVDEAGTAADGLRAWAARRPDLVLLDLGLPDRDGLSVIRQVRRESATPILVLSARGDEGDRVTALEQGADDYLTKPFGLAELRARINALLRRAAGPLADASGRLTVGSVTLDVARREVHVARPADRAHPARVRAAQGAAQPGRQRGHPRSPAAGRVGCGLCRGIALSPRLRQPGPPQAGGRRRARRDRWLEPGVGYRVRADDGPSEPALRIGFEEFLSAC